MGTPRIFTLHYPSKLDVLATAVDSIEALVASASIPRDAVENLAICTSEMINNAMVHGNNLDPSKEVKILLEIADNWIKVEISDEGTGFNPATIPSPVAGTNLERESGRGIYICNQLMDKVEFNRTKSGGMSCLLFKRIASASSSS